MNRDLRLASTYSPTLKRAVPSAQAGLTSLFGMGRGGPCCYRHLKRWNHYSKCRILKHECFRLIYRMTEAVK